MKNTILNKYFIGAFLVLALIGTANAGFLIAQDSGTINSQQLKDHQRTISDNDRQFRERRSEIDRLSKQLLKQAGLPADISSAITEATAHLDQAVACNESLKAKVGTEDFWNSNTCWEDHFRPVENILNESIRPANDFFNRKQNIENRRKELKNNIVRDIKEFERNKVDYTLVSELKAKIEAEFARADAIIVLNSDNADVLRDVDESLNGLFQDYYPLSQEIRDQSNQAQRANENAKGIKNYESQCKQILKEYGKFEKDIARMNKKSSTIVDISPVKALADGICGETGDLGKMKAALQNKDTDLFEDARSDFDAIQRDFWDSMNELRMTQQDTRQKEETIRQVERNASQMLKDLGRMKKEHMRLSRNIDKLSQKYLTSSDRKEISAALKDQLARFNELLAVRENEINSYKSSIESDPDSVDADDLDGTDFWEAAEPLLQRTRAMTEAVKAITRTEKELKRNLKPVYELKARAGVSQDTMDQLDALLSSVQEVMKQAWQEVANDPENVRDILGQLEDLGQEFEDITDGLDL